MKPRAIKKRFLKRIEEAGHKLNSLPITEGIEAMLRFYEEERVDGCDIDEEGDMLLFQWGSNDWGEGEFFEVEIARQLMDQAGEDEDVRQLRLIYRFAPDAKLRKLEDGNQWCSSLDEVDAFRTFIHSSQAFKAGVKLDPVEITLEFGAAG